MVTVARAGRKEPVRPLNLSAMNTLMAADRTLMAWIRTSLSFFSFGFAIYKILQELQQNGRSLPHENTPRNVGIFLAVTGVLAIVLGTIEYWQTAHELKHVHAFRLVRPALIVALVMCLSGCLLLYGMMMSLV